MKITARYSYPPIPDRDFDWYAIDDDSYSEGDPIGYGSTQWDAIRGLVDQLQEAED